MKMNHLVGPRVTLRDYVEELLKQGKRSKHPDFQTLFEIYGKDKIVDMAREILEKEKKETKRE